MSDVTIIYVLSLIGAVCRESVYPYTNRKQATENAYKLLLEENGSAIHAESIQILDKGIISVDGELFAIYRPKGWSRHDVRHIGNRLTTRT